MKKAEVSNQELTPDLEARFATIEARLEKLDPTPRLEVSQPYPIGGTVFSIMDAEARYPFSVVGYRCGRIVVMNSAGEREFPINSVVPFAKCKNAETNSEHAYEEMYARMDDKSRAYWAGRRKAEIAAKTTPVPPPPPRQRRYFGGQDEIPFHLLRSIGTGE